MTDRVKALTVVLDADYRIDDVQSIVNAIRMMRGVADVETHVTDFDDYTARARVRSDIFNEVVKAFQAKR